jgi:hypothetical protein
MVKGGCSIIVRAAESSDIGKGESDIPYVGEEEKDRDARAEEGLRRDVNERKFHLIGSFRCQL